MSTDAAHPIVLFDGECGLCSASVRFIISRDKAGVFRFAPLQSSVAQSVLARASFQGPLPDSVLLVLPADASRPPQVLTMSDASIAIASRLGLPWSLASLARVLPRGVRNAAYRLLARNRTRFFGGKQACMMPTDDIRARFL
jgi:predicted DCC family thiol-disulfide oxidoreductase YuxK